MMDGNSETPGTSLRRQAFSPHYTVMENEKKETGQIIEELRDEIRETRQLVVVLSLVTVRLLLFVIGILVPGERRFIGRAALVSIVVYGVFAKR